MKNIKLLSLLALIVTIVAVMFSLSNFKTFNKAIKNSQITVRYDSVKQTLQNMKEQNFQDSQGEISKIDYNNQLNEFQQKVESFRNLPDSQLVSVTEKEFSTQTFWIKVIFSGIFCIAALFVVLSKKYDDETKKWAFSVLTLIAGVWIGTIS